MRYRRLPRADARRRKLSDWVRHAGSLFSRRPLAAALLRVDVRAQVYEIACAGGGLEEIPALHPVVGALEFIGRDRCRIDQIEAALAQVIDGELTVTHHCDWKPLRRFKAWPNSWPMKLD